MLYWTIIPQKDNKQKFTYKKITGVVDIKYCLSACTTFIEVELYTSRWEKGQVYDELWQVTSLNSITSHLIKLKCPNHCSVLVTLIELITSQKNDMVPRGYYKNLRKVNTCSDHKVRLVSVHTCGKKIFDTLWFWYFFLLILPIWESLNCFTTIPVILKLCYDFKYRAFRHSFPVNE